MYSTPRGSAITYILCGASSSAALTLGLVSLLCFPAGSSTPPQLAMIAVLLVAVALCGLTAARIRQARRILKSDRV